MRKRNQNVVPLSSVIAWKRKNKYGSIADLPDYELADPEELERQAIIKEFGPVLALPVSNERVFRPDIDEEGVRCDAFASVDFERSRAQSDTLRYKEERLREELGHLIIWQDPLRRRLPQKAVYLVLKYARLGIIELDQIDNMDMYLLAQSHLRELRIRNEIDEVVERRCKRQRRVVATMFRTS